MKKRIHIIVLLLACCLAPELAAAQTTPSFTDAAPQTAAPAATAPALTDSATIAMIFGRLTGRMPDFAKWAENTNDYKSASPFEQPAIEQNLVQQLKDTYATLDLNAAVTVKTTVQLSSYDSSNHGFFVLNFKRSTFFPAQYAGKFYALVPQGIMDKQWLQIKDRNTVAAIQEAVAASKDGLLPMVLNLKPRYADKKPATIDGEKYFPIALEIEKMMLFSPDGQTLLWRNYSPDDNDKMHQNILNLYQ